MVINKFSAGNSLQLPPLQKGDLGGFKNQPLEENFGKHAEEDTFLSF
jgi:hypothetical protein